MISTCKTSFAKRDGDARRSRRLGTTSPHETATRSWRAIGCRAASSWSRRDAPSDTKMIRSFPENEISASSR
jgi:hypothetical protein